MINQSFRKGISAWTETEPTLFNFKILCHTGNTSSWLHSLLSRSCGQSIRLLIERLWVCVPADTSKCPTRTRTQLKTCGKSLESQKYKLLLVKFFSFQKKTRLSESITTTTTRMTSFYFNDNIDNATTLTNFVPFDDDIGLPFPLNTHPIVRLLLATSLLFVLVYGTHLRIKIFSFHR